MSAHLSEAVHALHAVPVNPTTEGCPICPDYLALVAAAVAAEREAWVGKIEALADAWADDTGIEGYINLGEAEDRLRALIAEARS